MVNWLKIAGIVLIVLGIPTFFAGLSVMLISHEPPGSTVIGLPWWVSPMGIAMIVAGAYLYYLGVKKMKKGGLSQSSIPVD